MNYSHSTFARNPSNTTIINQMERKYEPKKLTKHNYRIWKTKMKLILEITNLTRIANGYAIVPSIELELSDCSIYLFLYYTFTTHFCRSQIGKDQSTTQVESCRLPSGIIQR